jgi:hypothetical protein
MLIFSDFSFYAILFLLQSTSLLQNASQQNGVLCYLYNLFQNLIKNSRFCKMYRLMLHLANALAYSVLMAAESLHFCIFFQEQIRQTAELFYLMERIC